MLIQYILAPRAQRDLVLSYPYLILSIQTLDQPWSSDQKTNIQEFLKNPNKCSPLSSENHFCRNLCLTGIQSWAFNNPTIFHGKNTSYAQLVLKGKITIEIVASKWMEILDLVANLWSLTQYPCNFVLPFEHVFSLWHIIHGSWRLLLPIIPREHNTMGTLVGVRQLSLESTNPWGAAAIPPTLPDTKCSEGIRHCNDMLFATNFSLLFFEDSGSTKMACLPQPFVENTCFFFKRTFIFMSWFGVDPSLERNVLFILGKNKLP